MQQSHNNRTVMIQQQRQRFLPSFRSHAVVGRLRKFSVDGEYVKTNAGHVITLKGCCVRDGHIRSRSIKVLIYLLDTYTN